MPSTTEQLEHAARIVRRGGLVAFPTETVYGLGADALNPLAVARIFEAKQRPLFDPIIVHVAEREALEALAASIPPVARRLAASFWPGPLTLVLPKRDVVPDIVTAGLPTVAVRMPAHPVAQALIQAAGCPIAAPSANRFGRTSPTTAAHVREQLGGQVELILDGGPCRVGIESTVLLLTESPPVLLRHGGVTIEELEAVIGEVRFVGALDASSPAPAPGMLAQHYAPQTPLRLTGDWSREPGDSQAAALAFRRVPDPAAFANVEYLSPRGDLAEAAANLFAAIRRLDGSGARLIVAELVPEEGLGRAINDRLRRAAKRSR